MVSDERKKLSGKPHNIILEDRTRLSVSGVEDVDSFDDRQVVIRTSRGTLILRGSELTIDKLSLDTGELSVTGLVSELGYEDAFAGGNLWSRLFK
jgi:sporulation protein YabP